MEMRRGFFVDDERIGPGARKQFDEVLGRLDHEVHLEGQPGQGPQCAHCQRAESDVGDEPAVHHVNLNAIHAGRLNRFDLFAQTGALARVDDPALPGAATVFPTTPQSNVRDAASKEGNLSLQARQVDFPPLPTDPNDDAHFLRYPPSSPLARASLSGGPVGVPPSP